jgi:7-cyano-7-deazaguanine synthase in queuosine biosynthesis
MLSDAGWTVHSLFIDWNIRARPQSAQAAAITAEYCKTHVVFPYAVDWATFAIPVRKLTTPYATMSSMMLGIQYAQFLGVDYVVNGSRAEVNRDPRWREKFSEALNGNTMFPEKVLSFPVYDLTSKEVAERANLMSVDLSTTWSCSQYPACESCSSCRRRKAQGL